MDDDLKGCLIIALVMATILSLAFAYDTWEGKEDQIFDVMCDREHSVGMFVKNISFGGYAVRMTEGEYVLYCRED